MNRREATNLLTAIATGSLMLGPGLLLPACRSETVSGAPLFFTAEEWALLEQIAETILPTTPDSPGAKAAGIGSFMDRYVADCLTAEAQQQLRNGLVLLDEQCSAEHQAPFLQLSPDQQHEVLFALDVAADDPANAPRYYTLIKGLTLLGYFTSEAGATQALRYVAVPGRYEGEIDYREGEKAWAI